MVFKEIVRERSGESTGELGQQGESRELTWKLYCEEIRPYWLAVTKGYGLTVHDIDWSCPTDLHPYELAYELEDQKRENDIWRWCGDYFISAMTYSIEHCLNGKKKQRQSI